MRSRGEQGSATLLTMALAGVLLFVGTGLAVVGGVVVAQRQAQAAADLASLAAATAVAGGRDPCVVAAGIATANGAALVSCRVSGREVEVGVTVVGPHPVGHRIDVPARARAGPAPPIGVGP